MGSASECGTALQSRADRRRKKAKAKNRFQTYAYLGSHVYIEYFRISSVTDTRLSRPKCDCQYATRRDHSGSQSCWNSISNSRLHPFRGVKTHLSVSPLIQVTF